MTTYTWDPRGPLASVQRPGGAALIEYVLDPAGRRIGRKVGGALERGWLYAGGLLPVAETDGDGSTVQRVFVYATRPNVADLVRQLEGSEWVTYRVLVDHLGSVRTVMRASDGAVMQRMDYDAFGGVVDDWAALGWVRIPFGFAGGLYDRETGLVRFGAREYDARLGRWVSRDPALFGGGDGNLYRYCGGEPVNFIDVDGLNPTGLRGAFWRMITNWIAAELIDLEPHPPGDFVPEYNVGGDPHRYRLHVRNSSLVAAGAAARTIGDVCFYAPGEYNPENASHESLHTDQHQRLGPGYLPAHLVSIGASSVYSIGEDFYRVVRGQAPITGYGTDWYSRHNRLEQGPYHGRPWWP